MSIDVIIPDTHADLVSWDTKSFAHVATIGPDGQPHSSPVWFEWDGVHLIFTIDEKSQRAKNLRRNPKVAISIIDPEDSYRYVELRGGAKSIETDPELVFLTRMSDKYLHLDQYPWERYWEMLIVVKVLPRKLFGVR